MVLSSVILIQKYTSHLFSLKSACMASSQGKKQTLKSNQQYLAQKLTYLSIYVSLVIFLSLSKYMYLWIYIYVHVHKCTCVCVKFCILTSVHSYNLYPLIFAYNLFIYLSSSVNIYLSFYLSIAVCYNLSIHLSFILQYCMVFPYLIWWVCERPNVVSIYLSIMNAETQMCLQWK